MKTLIDDDVKKCIELCWQARNECQKTFFNHCLEWGGKHTAPVHVRLMADCMQACQAAADFMVRNSAQHAAMCAACADICEACARSCSAIGNDEMESCAKACRQCAESCRQMSESVYGGIKSGWNISRENQTHV